MKKKRKISPELKLVIMIAIEILIYIILFLLMYHYMVNKIYTAFEETKVSKENADTINIKQDIAKKTPEISTEQEQTTQEEEKPPSPPALKIPLNSEIQSFIYQKCKYDDEMYCLIIAVIKQESDFDHNCISEDGHDRGLMQLRDYYYPEWIEQYGVSDPEEIYDNLTIGITMIQEYLEKYEYKNLALMCYNMGEGGARKLWRQDVYSTRYTEKVLDIYSMYKEELKDEGVKP